MNIWLCNRIVSSLNKQKMLLLHFLKFLAPSPVFNRLADNHFTTNHSASIHNKHTPACDKKVQCLHLTLGSVCIGGVSLSHTHQSHLRTKVHLLTCSVSSSTYKTTIVG